jgi:hypothetical protein
MWDFDDTPLEFIIKELSEIQQICDLPRIYILNSGKPNHYMAYCFARLPWEEAYGIVAWTRHVDWNFLKYAAVRGHFTLRVSSKNGRKIRLVHVLESSMPETAHVKELKSWVKYETLTRSEMNKKWLLQISKNGCAAKIIQ